MKKDYSQGVVDKAATKGGVGPIKEGPGVSRTVTTDNIEIPEMEAMRKGDQVTLIIMGTIKSIDKKTGDYPYYNISITKVIKPPTRPATPPRVPMQQAPRMMPERIPPYGGQGGASGAGM